VLSTKRVLVRRSSETNTTFESWSTPVERVPAQQKGIAMSLTKGLTFLAAFLFMVGCAYGQDVHYNYDRDTDFASYKTYQWVDRPGGPPSLPGGLPNFPKGASDIRANGSEDPLIDKEIKRAVDEQLAQKGLTKVEKNADLQVGYHAAIRQQQSINLSGSGWDSRGFDRLITGSVQGQTSTIPIGTLVVDLYDPAKKQLVWRGDASKTIDLKKDPDKNYKNLQKAMAKLFKNYPPQPNK
jgi:hypothetical protein